MSWASSEWGGSSWGGGPSGINFVDAIAVRENVIRVEFTTPVEYTGLLEVSDASRPGAWSIAEVATTVGISGDAARPVSIIRVDLPGLAEGIEPEDLGRFVDLVLDRPMTPWPAAYDVSWSEIYEKGLETVSSGVAQVQATYRLIEPPRVDVARPSRDFANPQTLSGARDSLPQPEASLALGTFRTDSSGDYAADEGIASLKKRIVRRLMTRKGAFAHLPNYGVGVPDKAKTLGTSAAIAALRADAEAQVLQEPDVAQARVVVITSADHPSLVRFQVFVRPKVGSPIAFEVPFERAAE